MIDAVLDFLLSPMFRSVVLKASAISAVLSAVITWAAWGVIKKTTVFGIALWFTAWSLSSSFFGYRYFLGFTDYSPAWFILPNVASLGMVLGSWIYLYGLFHEERRTV